MPDFIVTRRATGEVVYAYAADEATDFPEFPFAQYNHTIKATIEQPAPERNVTKLQYLRRFTGPERQTIRQAAKGNPELEDYLAMLEIAQDINLDDPDTIAAVNMLEAVGLIAPGRAAEVLA